MTNAENLKIKQTKINNISFKELSIIKDFIFWVDILPDGQTYKNWKIENGLETCELKNIPNGPTYTKFNNKNDLFIRRRKNF